MLFTFLHLSSPNLVENDHNFMFFDYMPKIQAYLERLRENKIYILEIAKFLSGLDSNKNGVVSKSLDNSLRNC